MQEIVGQNVKLILNSVLIGLYSIILLFGFFRLFLACFRSRKFLKMFFSLVLIVTALELAIQIYQVIQQQNNNEISYPVVIVINIFAMIFQTSAIFSVSDFWGDTSEILTKQSTQQQLKEQKHWVRISILSIWTVIVSIFIGYSFATNQVIQGQIEYWIIVLGGQGIGVALVLIANVSQTLQGYRVFAVIRNFQEWVSSVSLHKIQFCLVYLTSSILNFLRCIFLIITTIIVYIRDDGNSELSWLLFFIYTCSNLPIMLIFFYGFTTKKYISKQTTLLESVRVPSGSSSPSRRQTQLSASLGSEKRETALSQPEIPKQIEHSI